MHSSAIPCPPHSFRWQQLIFSSITKGPDPWERLGAPNTATWISMGIISLGNFRHYKVKCSCLSHGAQASWFMTSDNSFLQQLQQFLPWRPSHIPPRFPALLQTCRRAGDLQEWWQHRADMGTPEPWPNTASLGYDRYPSPEGPWHPRTPPKILTGPSRLRVASSPFSSKAANS